MPPISQETQNILNEMAKIGVPAEIITSLRTHTDSNPTTDTGIKGMMSAQSDYTRNIQRAKELQGSLETWRTTNYPRYLQTIKQLGVVKKNLAAMDLGEAEIAETMGLSVEDLKKIDQSILDAEKIVGEGNGVGEGREGNGGGLGEDTRGTSRRSGEEMGLKRQDGTEINPDNLVTTDALNQNVAGSVIFSAQLQAALMKYQMLYGKFMPDYTTFAATALKNHSSGKSVDVTLEEIYKVSEKEAEITLATQAAKDKLKYEEGYAKALEENGVPANRSVARRGKGGSTLLRSMREKRASAGVKVEGEDGGNGGGVKVESGVGGQRTIVISGDDPYSHLRDEHGRLPYQRRGTKEERVAASAERFIQIESGEE